MKEQEILDQAKEILDNFVKELEKVKTEEARVERKENKRKEKLGEETSSEFKEIMLKNAPKVKDDCIEAEKGCWIE